MPIETFDDIIEEIANSLGIYGCGEEWKDHQDDCRCRICFVIQLEDRIRKALEIEKKLNADIEETEEGKL